MTPVSFTIYGDVKASLTGVNCKASPPARNAGNYPIICTGPATTSPTDGVDYATVYTDSIGTHTPGSLTITKLSITVTAGANTKIYDGTTSAAATPTIAPPLAPGDTASFTETYDNPNVAGSPNKTMSVSAYTVNDGNNGGNYTVTTVSSPTGVITPVTATITVTGYSVIYDGLAHMATGVATGIGGVNLSADLNLAGTTHTNVGTYNGDPWVFTDPAGNYKTMAGAVNDAISWTFSATPIKSSATLGSSVPVIWSLQNASGGNISDLSTLVELDTIFNGPLPAGGCVASTSSTQQPILLYNPATGAKGNSSFRFVSPNFQFNWDTNVSAGKGCYTVKIVLNDGTTHLTTAVQLK
jgi:hypothetical protein